MVATKAILGGLTRIMNKEEAKVNSRLLLEREETAARREASMAIHYLGQVDLGVKIEAAKRYVERYNSNNK